jgi:hypothetical protein
VRVRHGESVEPIHGEEALRTFLAQTLADIQDEDKARTAVLASLRLAEAMSKAGLYPFEKPEVSVARQGTTIVATAQAAVNEPSLGEVATRLEFSADGKLKPEAVKIDDRTRRGPPSSR